jgi:hypothetical protein
MNELRWKRRSLIGCRIVKDLAVGQQAEFSQGFFGRFHDACAIGTTFFGLLQWGGFPPAALGFLRLPLVFSQIGAEKPSRRK